MHLQGQQLLPQAAGSQAGGAGEAEQVCDLQCSVFRSEISCMLSGT